MIEKIKYKLKKIKFNFKINACDIIVWDYDGTLYQNDFIGKKLKNFYIDYLQKKVKFDFDEKWFDIESEKQGTWAKTVAAYTNQSIKEIIDTVEKNFQKHQYLKKNLDLVEKIKLLKNKKHFILSNSKTDDIKKGLKKIGFKNTNLVFTKIIGRDNCQHLKPNIEAFKDIQKMSHSPFHKHLMIGDSIQDDLEPAKIVGFKTMHINELNYFWKVHK